MAAILTAARSQLPNGLAANSVQTYLDGIAAYIYGYPLLSIAITELVSTNVVCQSTDGQSATQSALPGDGVACGIAV